MCVCVSVGLTSSTFSSGSPHVVREPDHTSAQIDVDAYSTVGYLATVATPLQVINALIYLTLLHVLAGTVSADGNKKRLVA